MAPCEQTLRTWHLAGNASQALACQIPVELLTLDGFTEADLTREGRPQRLDEGTLLQIPADPSSWGRPVGRRLLEALMVIAMGGPAVELSRQGISSTLDRLQTFPVDWKQAWAAAGHLWPEEVGRARVMARFFAHAPTEVGAGQTSYFVNFVSQHLMEHRRMEAIEIRNAWDEAHARHEKDTNRSYRTDRRTESDIHEAIGDLLIPPEWNVKDRLSPF